MYKSFFFLGEHPFLQFKMEFPQICWMPTQKQRKTKDFYNMDFCWNWTSLLWDSQTLSCLMRQLACCSVAVDSPASEITDHKGFCPCF